MSEEELTRSTWDDMKKALLAKGFVESAGKRGLWSKTAEQHGRKGETVRVFADFREGPLRVYAFCDDATIDVDAIARAEARHLRVEADPKQRRLAF